MKNSDILYNYLCWENGVLQLVCINKNEYEIKIM